MFILSKFSKVNQLFLLFGFLLMSFHTLSQRKIQLDSCYVLKTSVISTPDSSIITVDSTNIQFVMYSRENEYFTMEDTNRRSYLKTSRAIPIDSIIGLMQLDYSGSYDFTYFYLVKNKKSKYVVAPVFDGNCYGTDFCGNYIIFKEYGNGEFRLFSTYKNESGMPEEKNRIVMGWKKIRMKGPFLKKVTRVSLVHGKEL